MSQKIVKARHWLGVLYPESLRLDWRDFLQATGLQVAISPLHDKDLDPTGEPKKPHYHVILSYEGPTTFSVVSGLLASLGQPIPQKCESVKGAYRYFTHKDNPEKYQYSESDISFLNGFNIADFVELTTREKNDIKRRLLELICNADIWEYSDLIDSLTENGDFEGFDIASNNTLFFSNYLKSKRYKFGWQRDQ